MTRPQNTTSARLHGLDTLRALAILLVMLYHLSIQDLLPAGVGPVARIGWIGVDLFFVLSGFLIGSQLLKPYLLGRGPSLSDFYTRRAFRILPAFFAVLLLYLLVPLWREAPGPYAAWQYATFTWNLLLLGYPEHRAFSHIWSLCVEEHFYLLFPLLLLLLMRKPAVWKAALTLFCIVAGGVVLRACLLHTLVEPAQDEQGHQMMRFLYYPTYSRLDGLMAGVTLALVRTFRPVWWSRFTRHAGILAFIGLACVLTALKLCDFDYPAVDRPMSLLFTFPTLACGFAMLVASAVCGRGLLATRVPGASILAALAYSLYLTHKSVAHAAHHLLPALTAQPGWRSSTLYALACLAAACVLYWGVERPFLTLRDQVDRRRTVIKVDNEVHLNAPV